MDFKWEGTLPDVTSEFDFSEGMKEAAKYAWASVLENFDSGGRPTPWAVKKNGQPSFLYQSGKLRGGIDYRWDKESFAVFVSRSQVPYAFAQHFGLSSRKRLPRPYMIFQNEDREFIQSLFSSYIVNWFTTKRRPIGTQS